MRQIAPLYSQIIKSVQECCKVFSNSAPKMPHPKMIDLLCVDWDVKPYTIIHVPKKRQKLSLSPHILSLYASGFISPTSNILELPVSINQQINVQTLKPVLTCKKEQKKKHTKQFKTWSNFFQFDATINRLVYMVPSYTINNKYQSTNYNHVLTTCMITFNHEHCTI